MRKWLIGTVAGAAIAALAVGWLYAQPVVQNTFSGIECWNAGQGPGGPSTGFVCSQGLRGASNNVATTITGSFTIGAVGAAGVGATTNPLQYGGALFITAQPSAATITLPPSPLQDGIIVAVCNVTAAPFATNVTTLQPNTGQTLNTGNQTLTTLAAFTCATVQWNLAAATWYRTR
jgi:hypothetical protein